ncbi:glycosyltransferase [uncultured Parabacteroides sp.]|uniref:glycosyltransferase n=1 Tax=uncultured Parabacteroides sp. TaxID=512312 RepID=UPI00262A6034|nr:glycosyltransferase [uncultured Parabacteroides sp.]
MNGGGAEKVLADILSNFDYSSYKVDLLLDYNVGTHLTKIDKRVKVIGLHSGKRSLLEKVLFRCKPLLKTIHKAMLSKIVSSNYYDVIISFMEGPSAYYHSLLKGYALKNLTWIHVNLEVNHWSLKYWKNSQEEAKFYQSMDKVLCVSQGAKEVADRLFNLNGNSQVLYNLIDHNEICRRAQEREVEKQRFTVCNVGRLAEQKRQDRIIKIAKILKDRGLNIEFWILGVGPLESVLKEQARKAGVEDMVLFKGFQTNPYTYMKAADVFLLTSDTEGYPTVVCEALCLGKPIVSTNVTGVDELLANEAGIVCNYDVKDIADGIERLIKKPSLLKKYSQLSEKRGEEFDKETVMWQIYSLV